MRVFSVPVSAPFLRTVIAALVGGRLVDGFKPRARPADLAQVTLYLPTRRAGRMAREIFLDELKTDAVVLPRIVALGDIDEDELAFAEQAEPYGGVAPLDVPPKLGELDRRLTLARLVAAWAKSPVSAPLVVGGPASTLALASDLARLMDDMVTRGVGWEAGWCRINWTNTGSTRWNSLELRDRHGPRISRKLEKSSRRRAAIS